jgi:uncharacterized OB-fold protein
MNNRIETELPPVVSGVFTLPPYDKMAPTMLGGFCKVCGRYYFPKPVYCRTCLEQVELTGVGSRGNIYSYTVIRTKPPLGLPQPYAVGYIDLEKSHLRIFCLLDPTAIDQLQVGLPVSLRVGPLGHDGTGASCLRPYFSPRRRN